MSEPKKPAIEDLMCCGNCMRREGRFCLINIKKGINMDEACKSWLWDRLKGEDRR